MTSSAILPHPIALITAEMPVDKLLADALLASVAAYRTPLQGRRIWLACSGGRDSLVLAALCLQLYRQGKLPFLPQLLHVDHGLQADSSRWAAHVANWAHIQQLPCQVLTAQVQGHDEQAARQARYQVMLSHINQEDVLLLAHHADDQAETVLMRLIQGAGVKGLSGMQSWQVQSQGARRTVLWRPWLSVRRATISSYAQRLKLPYIDDPSNDSGDNVRSSLRREIMPALAVYNPNVIENIGRSATLLADAHAIVRDQAAQDLQQTAIAALQLPLAQRVLSIPDLHLLPQYRQRQLLHYWLTQDEPLPPSKQLIDEALILTQRSDNDHQTQLYWQGLRQQYSIRRYRQQLYRLNTIWLTWLAIPLTEQMQTLVDRSSSENSSSKTSSPENNLAPIILRASKDFIWQLQIMSPALAALKTSYNDKIVLKIAPLGRQQRLQTAHATRPQSGKKLYQTLGIPLWLRDSLVVVSLIFINAKDELSVDLPIRLLSPFDSWVLGSDKSVAHEADNKFDSLISSTLSVNDTR